MVLPMTRSPPGSQAWSAALVAARVIPETAGPKLPPGRSGLLLSPVLTALRILPSPVSRWEVLPGQGGVFPTGPGVSWSGGQVGGGESERERRAALRESVVTAGCGPHSPVGGVVHGVSGSPRHRGRPGGDAEPAGRGHGPAFLRTEGAVLERRGRGSDQRDEGPITCASRERCVLDGTAEHDDRPVRGDQPAGPVCRSGRPAFSGGRGGGMSGTLGRGRPFGSAWRRCLR